jgi:hypothetical protein
LKNYCVFCKNNGKFGPQSVANIIKLLGTISATSRVFPYDFARGYADSDEITLKKVL